VAAAFDFFVGVIVVIVVAIVMRYCSKKSFWVQSKKTSYHCSIVLKVKKMMRIKKCGGWDLNPRTPKG
jgi:hypothetical protein